MPFLATIALIAPLQLAASTQGGGEAPAPPASAAAKAPAQGLPSLLGGASLGPGGTASTLGLGWPLALAAYGQGVGERDDLGATLEIDWAASEFLLAGLWRREIARAGGSHLALRLRLGFYSCFGATWAWSDNRPDLGAQLGPGLAWSIDTASGVLAVGGDVPVSWTFKRGGGWIVAAKLGISYETPLWSGVSLGARAAAGVRGAGGGAPGSGDDRVLVEVTVLATWHPL